jgi:hypothetical protein
MINPSLNRMLAAVCRCFEERLDDSDIGAAFQQVGRKAVAQGVQRHTLPDLGCIHHLVEQPVELAGRHRLAAALAGKQPAFLHWPCGIVARWARLPPLSQQIEPPQRHAKQEPKPGHDAVAIADARAALGKVQLEAADILRCRRVRGSLEKCRKLFAAADIAPCVPAHSLRAFMSSIMR